MNRVGDVSSGWAWMLPIGLAIAVFLPSLWGERVWDDQTALGDQLAAFDTVAKVLVPPPGIPDWTYSYYRPMVTLSYLLDRRLAGPAAALVPHAANMLYHAITTGLLWMLAARLFAPGAAGAGAALLAATVFAIHPIHTESVSWITGRSDVLAALFVLPSLLLGLRWRDQGSPWAPPLSSALLFLGLLSKETAAAALLLMPLLYVLVPAVPGAQPGQAGVSGRALVMAACYALAVVLYGWLRHVAGVQAGEPAGLSTLAMAGPMAAATAFYLVKTLVPWPQCNFVGWSMVPGPGATALLLLSAAAVTAASVRAWQRRREPVPLVATGWFGITLLVPVWSAVGVATRTPLAERHLYLPLAGVALGLAWLWWLARARGRRALATAAAAAVLGAYALGTVQRGFIWQSDLALWTNATQQVRDQGLPWLNLGLTRWRGGDAPGALAALRLAAEGGDQPGYRARARTTMGMILLRAGDVGPAEEQFRAAIGLRPEVPEPYYGLASVYMERSRGWQRAAEPDAEREAAELAVHFLQRALGRNPRYYPARLALAAFLAERAEWQEQRDDGAGAAVLYSEARDQLNQLLAAFPADQREQALTVLRAEVGIDAAELRGRIEVGLSPRR